MDSAVVFEDRENLNDFLQEAELQQYYELFRDILKVTKVSQLKFVLTEDLVQIGLSRPEQRRYKKIYTKYFPNPYISKIRKMLKSNKRRDQNMQGQSIPMETLPVFDNNVKIPTKHIISIEDITINKELGMGQFGVVQQGTWTTGNQRLQVAIKCLGNERMTSNSTEFLKEAAVMHSIEHPNIVRLYGVVLHLDSLMLVTELAPLRSLLECLREVSLRLNFPVPNLCEFAEQICDGMTYLESKRLIHRDLAARNILVFNKDRVKISDFGLSRALGVGKDYYQTNYNVNLKLPVAWCAPECILFLRFTSASDVWAFGVCLWEMFTYGFQPWAAFSGQQILEAIDAPNYQRLERPECCPDAYYAVMLECWAHDINNRPKFKDLGPKLRSIRPEQVKAIADCQKPDEGRRSSFLEYKCGQIITVLGKENMTQCPLWYGVLPGCACGMFDPLQMKPYTPPEKNVCHVSGTLSPHPIRHSARSIRSSLLRSDVKRHTYTGKRTIQRSMISSPQGDVKHTGHVGLDGAYFGDISFLDPAGCPPRQVVTPYKPSEDLEQVPLINPNSPSHLTGATGTTPYPMLASSKCDKKADFEGFDLSGDNKTKSLKKSGKKTTSEANHGKGILNKVRSATLGRSYKVDNGAIPKTEEIHEYHEITDNNTLGDGYGIPHYNCADIVNDYRSMQYAKSRRPLRYTHSCITGAGASAYGSTGEVSLSRSKSDHRHASRPENLDVGRSTTDFSQSLLDEMESMFRNLDSRRRDEPSTSTKQPEPPASKCDESNKTQWRVKQEIPHKKSVQRKRSESAEAGSTKRSSRRKSSGKQRSQTLTKAERKKGFTTSTMKPMSAHDEKTLNTAVALANEITSKSMNDLGGDRKYPHSPSDRSKFHFKFPLSLHHGSHAHEPEKEKESTGRVERRNFSEEAKSVPDLQSTITAESKMVYTSLVEEPTPSTSLMPSNLTSILKPPNVSKPTHIPKPTRVTTHVQFHSLQNNSPVTSRPYAGDHTEESNDCAQNVLPLPPRTTKPKLIDKPRHVRKYPLKILEPVVQPEPLSAVETQAIIYQNTKRLIQKQEPEIVKEDGIKIEEPIIIADEVDSISKVDTNTNPFTNDEVAGPSYINPFDDFYDDEDDDELVIELCKNSDSDSDLDNNLSALVKDCKDHVSVEDLLEFAGKKPCGRQRGVESDEVRIMVKVLNSEATPGQCLEALELCKWEVHSAIKLIKLKLAMGSNVSFEQCHHQLQNTNGDLCKAIGLLTKSP